MIPTAIVIVAFAGIGWAVYYFLFSERAVNHLAQRLMSEPRTAGRIQSDYRAVITEEGIACEHPKRPREFIRWVDVKEISVRRTPDGPLLPDFWVLFVGKDCGCSIPTEAANFEAVFEAFKRFRGFDHGCFLKGNSNDAMYICWDKDKAYA
jgi:hypothetical protein